MSTALSKPISIEEARRADAIFHGHLSKLRVTTDRIFAMLLIFQWIGCLLAVMLVSPLTWIGVNGSIHIHVWTTLLLGAALTIYPVWLALHRPGSTMTRQVIAVAQMGWSALLIHVTGGRIETHFHVFGSLAFLAFYRDWKVLGTATVAVALDHMIRGIWWPQSVFGVTSGANWRWVEHAVWVVFENIFLIASCRRGVRELKDIAAKQSAVELSFHRTEMEVELRTRELRDAKLLLETAVRESEALRSTLNEHAIVSVADASGKIVDINETFCRISGYTREELIGQDHRVLNSGCHPKSFWVQMWKTIVSGQAWHGDVCNRAKDGSLYWVDSIIVPFKGADGRIEKYVSIRNDVTERKRAEEEVRALNADLERRVGQRTAELQASESRYRTLFDSIDEGFCIIEMIFDEREKPIDYRFVEINPSFEKQTGLRDAAGKRMRELAPSHEEHWFEIYGRIALTGEAARFQNRAEQLQRWFDVYAFRFGEPQDRKVAIIFRDITAQTNLESMLRNAKEVADNANLAKSEFLATMSHELRTPLNGVIGMTELLLGTTLDAQQRRYAWLAKSSGDSLLTLINDILDYSKIEAGKLELEITDFDLRYALESVAAPFASRAESKALELIAGVHPEVPAFVRGDPGRLQQILMNLVGNAIKFTESGEVVIRATLEDENDHHVIVRFTVNDTGIGIPHDRLNRLFESFSQVDASTTRKYGGTGLGLAICKQLVELMGGQIGVESEEGRGSTFWFTVSLEKQSVDGSRMRAINANLRNLRVLIVDDNATNREILHEQLTNWRIDHQAVADGNAALAALRDATGAGSPFGLAILDMLMPGMNGRELAQAIKADSRIQNTVLVLLTSSQETCDARQLRSEGFAGYSVKPVRQSQLLDTLTDAVACATAPVVHSGTAAASSAGTSRRRSRNTEGVRILLAEDHPISQEVAVTILRQAGYQCDAVTTGRQALDAVMMQAYDLILMDCQMPEMDGFTATQAIRLAEQAGQTKHASTLRLPIIALTANAIKGDRERCLEAGMDDYLSKPLNPDRLVDLIESRLAGAALPNRPEDVPRPIERTQCQGPPLDASAAPIAKRQEARPPFDLEMAVKQWGGDRNLVLKMIPKFQIQAQGELQQIEQSIAAADAELTRQLAHGLKGSASYLHAVCIRDLAAQLEAMGRNGDISNAGELLAALHVELHRCLEFSPESATSTDARQPVTGGCDANSNC